MAKIYQKSVKGRIRNIKWLVLIFCLGIYFTLPFLVYERGEGVSNQAFLIDTSNQKILFFGLEIWPEEFYLFMILMIIAAFGLFAVTSVFGRIWCGFTCPQTIWTDLFYLVERLVEGNRNKRIINDRRLFSPEVIFRKSIKHILWLIIAFLTGGTIILYFNDAYSLLNTFFVGTAPTKAYIFCGIITFTTYVLAGFAREKVCTHMCPWPRFQGAMFDNFTTIVTYQKWRGEPRGALQKTALKEKKGDCIDCGACVAVCPTGIDIRDGVQLECIGCGLCVDACDEIMQKVGFEKNLITFDNLNNQQRLEKFGKTADEKNHYHFLRFKPVMYFTMLFLFCGIFLYLLINKSSFEVSINHETYPMFVTLSNGDIRNSYTIKLTNKNKVNQDFNISLNGLSNYCISLIGNDFLDCKKDININLNQREIRNQKFFILVPENIATTSKQPIQNIEFIITAGEDIKAEKSIFEFR